MSPRRVVLAAAAAAIVLSPAHVSAPAAATPAPDLERLVGQSIVTAFGGRVPSAALLARVRAGQVGGVVLFDRNIGTHPQVATLVAVLQKAASDGGNPRLLVAVDQEGGAVKRFRDDPPDVAPADMTSAAEAESQGAATAYLLRGVGVDVDFAPVLDTPSSAASFIRRRAFSRDPALNATLGAAFARGLQRGGVAATAKHFPGLGTARATTDRHRVVIMASRQDLDRRLVPFEAAVREGVKLVMVSNAAYAAYDSTRTPAVLSHEIVTTLLREQLGFDGVVITDALETPATSRRGASVRALAAGVDLLLCTNEANGRAVYDELLAAARDGRLRVADLERAGRRIAALKRWLARA